MIYLKKMPVGLWILSISFILFTIYYYIRPFFWGADISIYSPMFTLTAWGFVIWFNIILEIIGIYAVTFGFYNAKNWARLYVIILFINSSFWNYYILFIEKAWPYERFTWVIYYVFVISYLLMSDVKEYFTKEKGKRPEINWPFLTHQ
jgi:hypothetical protein